MNKQKLAAKIWQSANQMRSKIEANEYKDYILGFMFWKFLSEREVKTCLENDFSPSDLPELNEGNPDVVEFVKNELGYFISYENLFQTWIDKGGDFSIADVRDALSAFNRHVANDSKSVFEGIFETLESGLSKLGTSTGEQTKSARDLIHLIDEIPMDGRQDYDILGFIYEYLISNFAANAGKKAGEFYTPHEVSTLMAEIVAHHLRDREEFSIYDPTSGSGSLLINIGKAVEGHAKNKDAVKYFAQELKQNTYNLTRMNLVMRDIKAANIVTRNADTLEDDWPYFEDSDRAATYELLLVDAVVSNPPYSQNWDPEGKELDPRYQFGLAPKSKADYAFLLHDLYHLKPNGIMTIVLPHGVLFRGNEEGEIRKNLLENGHIQAVIGLPSNIFFGTGIPTIIMVLRKDRTDRSTLIVDASKGFEKVGKNNALRKSDIRKIVDVVSKDLEIEGYSRLVSLDEIRANDYNLNIPRYVDSSEPTETWDIYSSMFGGIPKAEASRLSEFWAQWPSLKDALFSDDGSSSYQLKVEDIRTTITENPEVKAFLAQYSAAFVTWEKDLNAQLISDPVHVKPGLAEKVIGDQLFERMTQYPLIDSYAAYQVFADEWGGIAQDLEIVRTEGFQAVKASEPLTTTKKQRNKEVEVQVGWTGKVIPLTLVQERFMSGNLAELKAKDDRLSAIDGDLESLFAEVTEENKSSEAVAEGGESWDKAGVTRTAKALKKEIKLSGPFAEDSFEEAILAADRLYTEKTQLTKQVKALRAELEESAKKRLEQLSDEEARELLSVKWVEPILDGLNRLAQLKVEQLVAAVEALASKYESTFAQVVDEIRQAEKELAEMLDELTGNEFDMRGIQEFKKLLGGI